MSRILRKYTGRKVDGLFETVNEIVDSLGVQGLLPHYTADVDATITALAAGTAGSSLATSRTLLNLCIAASLAHGLSVDATGIPGMHSAADATLDTAAVDGAATLGTCQTAINLLKAELNTHLANTTIHRGATTAGGPTITIITAADASDQGTFDTLVNNIRAVLVRHAKMGAPTLVSE